MSTSTSSLKQRIAEAKSASECQAIQNDLDKLYKRAQAKKSEFIQKEAEDALNVKGRHAKSCSFCDNKVDSRNKSMCATCDECNKIACKECFCACDACGKVLCGESECGMQNCVSCDESFCPRCTENCSRCCEHVCEDCVILVAPPQWRCCHACRDDWVEDCWREY